MHHHGDLHQALIILGVVIVGHFAGMWAAGQLSKVSPAMGQALGTAFNWGAK